MFFFQNTTQLLQDSLFIKTSTTSTWSSRRTPKTGEAEKIKRNAIDGRRQLTCDDAIPTSGQHILLHRTLRFPHSFRRRRLPSIPTLAFTCHPAWATILRTTTSCFRHHLHLFRRSRLHLTTMLRWLFKWCPSVRDWMPPTCNRRHITFWKN